MIEDVPPVEYEGWLVHACVKPFKVQRSELIPFSHDRDGVGALRKREPLGDQTGATYLCALIWVSGNGNKLLEIFLRFRRFIRDNKIMVDLLSLDL